MSSFSWSDLKKAAEDAGFVVIPKNTYNAVISKSAAAKTSNGKDQIKVTFKVLDGPFAGKPVPNQFVISTDNPTALGFFFRHMKALGLDGNYFAKNPSLDQVANDLLGKNCQIDVIIDVWNGEERNKIAAVRPLAAAGASLPTTAAPQPQPQPQAQSQPAPVAAQPQPVAVAVTKAAVAPEPTEDPAEGEPVDAGAAALKPPGLPF